jgi:hypothetical protein
MPWRPQPRSFPLMPPPLLQRRWESDRCCRLRSTRSLVRRGLPRIPIAPRRPRATDASFDPQPGDRVTLVDDDSETQMGRVTRRDGNRVWVQLDQPGTPPSNERTIPTNLGMICTCDAERLAKADAALDAVIARLASGSSSFHPHTVTRESFLDEICHSLHSMGASVGAIHVDQWAAVMVEGVDPEGWDAEVVAACDRVPDGLAACWSWVAAGGFHGGTPPPGAPAI